MNICKTSKLSKSLLFAGTSALVLSMITPAFAQEAEEDEPRVLGAVTVTTQKTEESIQDVPIAVSAFDENTLDKLQLAGGPDLVKSIPNVAFTKSNFTGYNFKIRGIGADVIAQSGDAGVGVHMNDVPLTGNRLFEAEFYDIERVETLRGPQGTLYGRNATAGVVNVITNKPVIGEQQSFVRTELGTYGTLKFKGMANLPLNEKVAVRVAGSYLKRNGFADNVVTGNSIDDRDLYSVRATLGFEPNERSRGWVMLESFKESDNRIRAGKQLCKKDPGFTTLDGVSLPAGAILVTSLGCQEASLAESYERVNSAATLAGGLAIAAGLLSGDAFTSPLIRDWRKIESAFDPDYKADMTVYAARFEYDVSDNLTVSYTGSYSESSVYSKEDYNKIAPTVNFNTNVALFPNGVVNDPQLGSSNKFRTFDLSGGSSKQYSHELRIQSDLDGSVNFNAGLIMIDYEATPVSDNEAGYYVFSNALTALAQLHNAQVGATSGRAGIFACPAPLGAPINRAQRPGCPYVAQGNPDGTYKTVVVDSGGGGESLFKGGLMGNGGNYFRSLSPYTLESIALFGEVYVDVSDETQVTLGLRVTDDKKKQDIYPTILFSAGDTYRNVGEQSAGFEEVTGRIGVDWKPDWEMSDDTLVYAFYSKGYKGGGINPPQPAGAELFPLFFEPEFVNSFEIGAKNTFDDGRVQLNATGFVYDYQGYQITQIINRTSANFNIDAGIQGLELEIVWNPQSNFLLNSNLGFLKTSIKDTTAIDVLDRTNGNDKYMTIKNGGNYSNCVISKAGFRAIVIGMNTDNPQSSGNKVLPRTAAAGICGTTNMPWGAFADDPTTTGDNANEEAGFIALLNPLVTNYTISGTAANFPALQAGDLTPREGFAKNLDGNAIPNAPELTWNLGMEYTWPAAGGISSLADWDMTARVDYYYQADSYSRVWNTVRDEIDSWGNFNLVFRMENATTGMSIELFGKNVTDEEVITGTYLTDDSSGLFTNIFLTDPATWGVAVSKSW